MNAYIYIYSTHTPFFTFIISRSVLSLCLLSHGRRGWTISRSCEERGRKEEQAQCKPRCVDVTQTSCQGSLRVRRTGSPATTQWTDNSPLWKTLQCAVLMQMWSRVKPGAWSSFFYIHGVVHHEFIPRGESVNAEVHSKVLRLQRENNWHKWPELSDSQHALEMSHFTD